MSENHPAWRSYYNHQAQYSYPSQFPYQSKSKLYDQDKDNSNPELIRATKQYAHELGMVKDLMIVLMNLLEKQGASIGELYELLEENTDMIDLLIAGTDDGD